jgi:alkylated DNA repair dioxygenase AlkB
MNTLFPMEPAFPQGFSYKDDFLAQAEEAQLLGAVKHIPLRTFTFQGFEARRKTASFGYDYSFDKRSLSKGEPIPQELQWLVQKVADFTAVDASGFAELLITEYPPGSVINWHRDAPPFDIIVGISLLSDCIFKLRPHEKQLQTRKSIITFTVKRRSLYIIKDVARTDWQHSTAPVENTRYSITLRTLRNL